MKVYIVTAASTDDHDNSTWVAGVFQTEESATSFIRSTQIGFDAENKRGWFCMNDVDEHEVQQ